MAVCNASKETETHQHQQEGQLQFLSSCYFREERRQRIKQQDIQRMNHTDQLLQSVRWAVQPTMTKTCWHVPFARARATAVARQSD